MKNLVLPIAFLVFSSTLYGQYDHNIQFINGNSLTHSVTDIDSISFSTSGTPVMHLQLLNGSVQNFGLGLINQVIFQGGAAGIIGSINCGSATINGTLVQGAPASEVSVSIPYTSGNGSTHNGQAVVSMGVGGLTATLSPGTFANGNGTLSYTITGTPQSSGMANFTINIGGQSCTLTITVNLPAGTISSLNCGSAIITGTLIEGVAVNGVIITVPYTGGNGGIHNGQALSSTGVSELTATLAPGIFANGSGTLSFTITGTPQSIGAASFAINIGGQMCTLTILVTVYVPFPSGTVHCIPGGTAVIEIFNPTTGRIWMDRNLGASQVATSATDSAAYGDLYQWGRFSDGHQCRNSDTTSTLASTAAPNQGSIWDGKFIYESSFPDDWLSPQNDNLWQGVNGINNPCPLGYRIPTSGELDAERLSWGSNNSAGAFGSPLKITTAGHRRSDNGELNNVGSVGFYRSSTVSAAHTHSLHFWDSSAGLPFGSYRAAGFSVRCIKD